MSRELKPGLYRLTKTVKNPKPDRRQEYDWSRWPEWKENARFYVWLEYPEGYLWIYHREDLKGLDYRRLPAEFLEALEPVEPQTVNELLHSIGEPKHSAYYAIERLVEMGKITYDDIREAIRGGARRKKP